MSDEKLTAVGIDLGTTFSVVASLDHDGKPVTVPNDEGGLSTPSVVYFDTDCTVVGEEAVNASEFAPERAARFTKRDIGNDSISNKILGHSFPPEIVLGLILEKLKNDAELKIGPFSNAVITVPAYFNEPRRKATQDAGRLAGIEVLDIINEPTAAALAFGVTSGFVDDQGHAKKAERVLVYDLGGGTFDVTLMEIEGATFNTIATAGDVHLGGMDWDGRIMHHLADAFEKEHQLDPRSDLSARQKLLQLASRAKKTLTSREQAQVRFAMNGKNSVLSISRSEFESITEDLVERTRMTVRRLLKDSQFEWSQVTRLLLVGGSTRMPMIQSMLKSESGLPCDRSLSPDEAVAHGAAIYAQNILSKNQSPKLTISNVNSHDLGVLGRDPQTGKRTRQLMIPRNSKIPITQRRKFVTSKEGQKEVMVVVVEGGTDTGAGAMRIGNCHVTELPDNLPKNTPVFVTFQYTSDGRLSVNAELPTVDVNARTAIDRSSGMSEKELRLWQKRIRDGIQIGSEDSVIVGVELVEEDETDASGKRPLPAVEVVEVVPGSKKKRPTAPKELAKKGGKVVAKKPAGQKGARKPSSPKSTSAPLSSIPVFDERPAHVEESKIVVGSEVDIGAVSDVFPAIESEEKAASQVEESQIVVEATNEKPKSVKLDALDDFLKNID